MKLLTSFTTGCCTGSKLPLWWKMESHTIHYFELSTSMPKISNLHTYKETKNNSLLLIWESTKAISSRTVHLNTTNSYQKSVRINEVHFLQYISQKKYPLSVSMPVRNERGSTLLLLLWTALYGKLIKKTFFFPVYLNTCVSHIPGTPFGPCSPLSPGDPFSPF